MSVFSRLRGLVALPVLLAACAQPPAGCPAAPAELAAIAAAPPMLPLTDSTEVVQEPTLQLALNIPAYRVDAHVQGEAYASYTVAVGTRTYPTKTGEFYLQSITWNPVWVPPESPWARNEKVTPPGPRNPMGKVKINYSPMYYLHGTPDSMRLERPVSHGCVRMRNQDAIELALLVHVHTGTLPSEEERAALLSSWARTRTIVLPRTVPLRVTYELAELRDTLLYLYADIYRQGDAAAAVTRALEQAGIGLARVDSAALQRLLAADRPAQMHLDSLLILD